MHVTYNLYPNVTYLLVLLKSVTWGGVGGGEGLFLVSSEISFLEDAGEWQLHLEA